MVTDDFACRPLSPNDGERINELYARSYGKVRSLAQWRWEYLEGPGGEPVLWGAESDGRLVGHYALIPVPLSNDGRPVSSAKAESAMVDPDCRGRGICSRLVRSTLEDAAGRGIQAIWGFPNEQSFAIMQKSGRRHIAGLDSFVRLSRPLRILRGYVTSRLIRHHHAPRAGEPERVDPEISFAQDAKKLFPGEDGLVAIDRFDERFDRLWESAQGRLGFSIVRSSDYLRWRFSSNPNGRYVTLALGGEDGRLRGYMISTLKSEMGLRIGYVADVLVQGSSPTVFDQLLSGTLHWFEESRADMVTLLLNRRHSTCRTYLPILSRYGFRPRKGSKKFAIKILADELGEAGYRGSNWYLSGAFGEGVEF